MNYGLVQRYSKKTQNVNPREFSKSINMDESKMKELTENLPYLSIFLDHAIFLWVGDNNI